MFAALLANRGISLERLQTLCAVADAGSIVGAAGRELSRQSLFSRQIRELEAFFGIDLTRRRGKGIELTPEGEELARQARGHLQSLADFRQSCTGLPVEFRFGAGNSVVEWLLIPNLAQLSATVGAARFFFSDLRTADIIRRLKDHRLDFGIVRKSAVTAPLKFHSIGGIGYALFAPSAWIKGRPDPGKLLRQHPVALSMGGEFSARFRECCEDAKLAPDIRFLCASFTQAAELVRTGQALSVLPELAGMRLATGHVTRLDFPLLRRYQRELGIAWHPRLLATRPATAPLLEALRKWRVVT